MNSTHSQAEAQKRYYAETAATYEQWHMAEKDEHYFALSFLLGMIDYYEIKSILDVGAGTGRSMLFLKEHRPDLIIRGIEPVAELREIGYQKGLSREELTDGDATKMSFAAGEFDLVTEFAVLHHIAKPQKAVAEMLRVAKTAIFVSDANNFGQGSLPLRTAKQIINAFGLWKAFDLVKTRGKGYMDTEEEGISYSYSVFDNFKQIRRSCRDIHIINTKDAGRQVNPYRSAEHIALLGAKK